MFIPLQLGFFIQPVHPPERPYRTVLEEDRKAFILADRLGYREAFVGEHIADGAETITSSLAFIANLAGDCPNLVFGTGVLPLPHYHPAMLAAQIAMVDHLVSGRLVIGVGTGVPCDAAALGTKREECRGRLDEALDQLLAIWSHEAPYRLEGKYYSTSTVEGWNPSLGLGRIARPLQRPHPPIALSSIRPHSNAPRVAGERGFGGLSPAYVAAPVVREQIAAFRAGRRAAGLSDDAREWRVARSIFVADDARTARRQAKCVRSAAGFYFRMMRAKLAAAGGLAWMRGDARGETPAVDEDASLAQLLDELVIAGTPDQVVQQLLAFRESVGPFGSLLYTGHDWMEPALARRSMELMATDVWPAVLAQLPDRPPLPSQRPTRAGPHANERS